MLVQHATICRVQYARICVQNFKLISSKMAELWHNTYQKETIFRMLSFNRFWCLSVLGHFLCSLRKSDLKTWITPLNPDFFIWPFLPGDLRWPWPILWSRSTGNDTNVRDTIHANSLALFELNSEILLTDVTKPEKSNTLALTWPVTSPVTPRSLSSIFHDSFSRVFKCHLNF